MAYMTVPSTSFVQAMRNHWTSPKIGNHTNPELEKCWEIMGQTFNSKIRKPDDKWHVLQPSTGSGKSQGLCVYCSLLGSDEATEGTPTGVLIVVRLKQQADDMADTINEMAGERIALSKHSDAVRSPEEIDNAQVLIITHKAYQIAIDPAHSSSQISLPSYVNWKYGLRPLVVIDEAIDVVDHFQVTAEDIKHTIGYIPLEIERKHPEAVDQLRRLLSHIETILDSDTKTNTRLLWKDGPLDEDISLVDLQADLKGIEWDIRLDKEVNVTKRRKKAAEIDSTLTASEAILKRYAYYFHKKTAHTLNTSHLIIPEGLTGPVVLDATASSNLLWQLFGDRLVAPAVPVGRRYDNVTIHLCYDFSGVGKTSMVPNAIQRAEQILSDLNSRLDKNSKALVVSHKATEFAFHKYLGEMDFSGETGHFGALDGRNDWKDFDTVVIAGLPYRDRSWSINSFLALQSVPNAEWFNSEDNRPFRKHKDILKALQSHQVCVEVLQAVNRVRCRKVTSSDGNCDPTDVYITMPRKKHEGEELRSALHREMPGAKIDDWILAPNGKRLKPRNNAELFFHWVSGAMPGEYSISAVQKALKLTQKDRKSLMNQLSNPESSLRRRLPGLRYYSTGRGKGRRAFVAVDADG